MATKTIRANVTLHLPGEGHKPFSIDANGAITAGKYVLKAVAPGTPVEIDAEEADAMIARGVAEEFKPEKPEKAGTPSTTPAA